MIKELKNSEIELLNLVIAGSVDDGKSTLIGRLFYDSQMIYEDQLESIQKASSGQGDGKIDFSLFTDGLSAEREQKITIDVAYRYFATPKRRFIIADVPGHEQYTRNMITGASNADLAIILADARKGLLEQSKRHLFIASLLGIHHILVVVNKMDMVGYQKNIFEKIKDDFADFSAKLNIHDLQFIPISAVDGDMVVNRKENMNWYQGSTVLSYLENLEISSDRNLIDFRFPVQLVIRPNQDSRGYLGRVESGVISIGEEIIVLPSLEKTKIKSIVVGDQEQKYAFSPQSVTLFLEDEIDISRGNMIVREHNQTEIADSFDAMICWMTKEKLEVDKSYMLKHATMNVRCFVENISYKIDINSLHRNKGNKLKLNEIGRVTIKTNESIMFDYYNKNKNLGNFIIIDEKTNNTVGVGVILNKSKEVDLAKDKNFEKPKTGTVIWFTGLSGSGKTTIADKLFEKLEKAGVRCERLDGDSMRQTLSKDLGFSPEDRDENIKRVAFLARLLSRNGITVIATFISPYKKHRELVKRQVDNFAEIFINTPIEICEKRDTKDLYQKARLGEIKNFTGISSTYEKPKNPDIEIDTQKNLVGESVDEILDYLKKNKFL